MVYAAKNSLFLRYNLKGIISMRTRIKELCREKGMTISAIAEQIGTTQTSLSRALGDNGNPTLETLDKIANALNVHITELFEQPQSNEAGITCPHCGKSITIKVE
jgi:hypothetical protein